MDVQSYLERIDYHGSLEPTLDTLRGLHVAHLMSVPFENLSIKAGEPIVLEEAALFNKIVNQRRGGFCYELNGLFAWLLRELGYDVTMMSAGVANRDGVIGPDFDHMTLMVKLDSPWLADVGFGDCFREPILIDETQCPIPTYRIIREGDHHFLQEKDDDGAWRVQYRFTLQPRQLSDFLEMCYYQQTSPQSHFTQRRICTMATPKGRITLNDLKLVITENDQREERMLLDIETCCQVLRDEFGILLNLSLM
jgi:N-hydroxyarylamine O-acetyltransferase